MEVRKIYGSEPIKLDHASNYSIIQGYSIPEKYQKKNILKETILNENLLKKELDFIIKKTPIIVIPFGWQIENFGILKAEVEQFGGHEDKAVPIIVSLQCNRSLECIEPDLTYEGKIDFFRALPGHTLIDFKINGEKYGISGVCVKIHRYFC